jgi:hypothetical protein
MNGYFAAGRLSEDEKNDILKLHTSVYNGYRTMQPEVKNEQPLYVYDPAQDKVGAVINNKGDVKPYTNVGINESVEEGEMCEQCGGQMNEGICEQCGGGEMEEQWQAAVVPALERMAVGYVADKAMDKVSSMFSSNEGEMEEGMLGNAGKKVKNWMDKPFSPDVEDFISKFIDAIDNPKKKDDDEDEDSQPHKSRKRGGKFKRHEYTESEVSEYETGHLDDIYDESDLNPNSEFDYVKGASNRTNAFHMKEQDEDYIDNFEDPDNEDDGFEDINSSEVTDEINELGTDELVKGKKYKYKSPSFEDEIEYDMDFDDERGGDKMYKFKGKDSMSHLMAGKGIERFLDYLDEQGGGNAPDFDISNVDYAYDFKSKGPAKGDGPFDEKADDMDLDSEEVGEPYTFDSNGPGMGDSYPVYENEDSEVSEYEEMESAWAEEMDEIDVSGVQGIYGAMKPAYDFDSDGPGEAGPYQHSQYNENQEEDEDAYWEKDLEDDELDLDFEKFNPRNKSWEEITTYTGEDEFSHLDEDIVESVTNQRNKIMEMMNRMKIIK